MAENPLDTGVFRLGDHVTAGGGTAVGTIISFFRQVDPATMQEETYARVEYTTGRVVPYAIKFLNKFIAPHAAVPHS